MEPTAQGSLARTPLAHLLVYCLERKLTGSLVLLPPGAPVPTLESASQFGQADIIRLREGLPAKVRIPQLVEHLGKVLLDLGLIPERAMNEAVSAVHRGEGLLGHILVQRGAIDAAGLQRGLRAQLSRKLSITFDRPEGTRYSYYEGVDWLVDYGGEDTPIDPLPMIFAAVHSRPSAAHVEATVAKVMQTKLHLRPHADLSRFDLSRAERLLCEPLREHALSLEELINTRMLDVASTQLVVYGLLLVKQLEVVTPRTSLPSSPASSRPTGAPSTPKPITTRTGSQPPPPLSATLPPPRTSATQPTATMPPPRAAGAPSVTTRVAPAVAEPTRSAHILTPASLPGIGRTEALRPGGIPTPASLPGIGRMEALRPGKIPTPASLPGISRREQQPGATPMPQTRSTALVTPPPRSAATPATTPTLIPEARPHRPTGKHAIEAITSAESARAQEIRARAAAIADETFFQMLGLSVEATADEARTAYVQLAKRWHPDRLPPELEPLRAEVEQVFRHLSEAFATLSDEEKRKNYRQLLAAGGGTPREQAEVARLVEAAQSFRKALFFAGKGALHEAEPFVQQAYELDPDEPEHIALWCWIIAQRPERRTIGRYEDLLERVDAAFAKAPQSERVRYYRAMLLKLTGRTEEAIRELKTVAENNPRNIDAVREVRLHQMRLEKEKARKDEGLLGRLLPRKK